MKLFITHFSLLILLSCSLDALTFKNKSNADVNFSITLIHPRSAAKDAEWLEYVYVQAGREVVKNIPQLKLLPFTYTVTGKEGGKRFSNYIIGGKEFRCGQHGMGFGDINSKSFVYEDGKCQSE